MTMLRNVLGLLIGIVIGAGVNAGLILYGSSAVPPPEGVDPMDPDSLAAGMHLFEARHFVFPFLAHALGTFVAAMIAALIAASHRMLFALVAGAFFLLGGIVNTFMLPAPAWFIALDLVVAYLPAAWLGGTLVVKLSGPPTAEV